MHISYYFNEITSSKASFQFENEARMKRVDYHRFTRSGRSYGKFVLATCFILTLSLAMAWTTINRLTYSLRRHFHRYGSSLKSTGATHSFDYKYKEFLEQECHEKIIVSYFTDIEGDKFYLDRYVDNSKILKWTLTKHHEEQEHELDYPFPYDRRIDFSNTNSMLVFGGDVWDKGGYDLYVIRQLLDLKRRYDNRVLWVLGNRDINKLRIPQELGLPLRPSPYHPGMIWFQGSGRVGDPEGPLPPDEPGQRLKWILSQTMGSPNAMEHRRHELMWEANGCCDIATNDYDHDDKEKEKIITDLDVVRSYQESCHPEGEMGLYLSQALIAAPVGPILFVHGSLPLTNEVIIKAKAKSKSVWDDLTSFTPWIPHNNHSSPSLDYRVKTIEDWFDAVNQFCIDSIQAWTNDINRIEKIGVELNRRRSSDDIKEQSKKSIWAYRAGYNRTYSDLIQYGMGRIPGGGKNPTVVYNSFTPEGMPQSFIPLHDHNESGDQLPSISSDIAMSISEFFERSSIQLILTGHKPQGDLPSPIRINNSSWIICADTSYSGDTIWYHFDSGDGDNDGQRRSNIGRGNSISFRGDVAVSEVLVELSNSGTTLDCVRYHGVLSDGYEYESVNLLDDDNSRTLGQVASDDSLVPKASDSPHENGRWWTKSIFQDGSHLYYAGEGYHVWNYVVSSNNNREKDTDENL